MADADEDVIPRGNTSAEDIDLTEETQDFRFLASISREDASIPKRGEKDFEPHATELQSNTLEASRQAMHNALSFQRVHHTKNHNIATYHPESNMAYAYNPRGPLFARMGQVLSVQEDPIGNDERRGQRMWLLPEEVIYLIERGSLDVRWPSDDDGEGEEGLPMSLQGAYAMFIGESSTLTFERYSVYASLKRSGYTVHRAPSWNSPGPRPGRACYATMPASPHRPWYVGLSSYFSSCWYIWPTIKYYTMNAEDSEYQLVTSKLYRSYDDIYRRLALIPYYDPTTSLGPTGFGSITDPAFRVTYHVWKPGSATYKKSEPGPPDFRVAVVNGRETSVPTVEQIGALFDTVPYQPPLESAQLYQKLRQGYKSVILAVVDQGVVSYLRFADAAFGREKLYERKSQGPGGKRGGFRGGRGRGRGR